LLETVIMKFGILFILVMLSSSLSAQNKFYLYEKSDKFNLAPWLVYNKTDGLFTGLSSQYFFNENFFAQGELGYAFSGKYPRYHLGFQKSFPHDNNEFLVAVEYYRSTVSNDAYVIPEWQNSLTSLLFRLDYYNHYETRGAKIKIGENWGGTYRINFFGTAQKYFTLNNTTEKSLFGWGGDNIGGKRHFSRNPAVAEGRDILLGLDYEIDFRPSPLAFVSAWYLKGVYSNSAMLHKAAKSDFSYARADFRFTRFQRLSAGHKMVASLRIASYEGKTFFASDTTTLPRDQFLFDAGGYGSLRGYRYREFENGNRLAVLSWDYFFSGWIFKTFNLVFFSDVGNVWSADPSKSLTSFQGTRLNAFKADAGAGIALADYMRLDWAYPLKKGLVTPRGDSKVYFRLTVKF
jgi:outer membrane protein assembly factor BamA